MSDDRYVIHHGDCLEIMRGMEAGSVDAVVTDPPYGLAFMGKSWDHGVPGAAFWTEASRVAKPGAHLLAFGGTRTFHRLACAIEDAGWEIRDCLSYLYGSGFPKSHNIGCRCEPVSYDHAESGPERDVRFVPRSDVPTAEHPSDERGEVLFSGVSKQGAPAHRAACDEPEDARREQPRMEGRGDAQEAEGELLGRALRQSPGVGASDGASGRVHHGASAGDGDRVGPVAGSDGSRASPESPALGQSTGEPRTVRVERGAQEGRGDRCEKCGGLISARGLGTALKPAWEPVILARKPLIGTVAANHAAHGTGALNIDGCRIETSPADAKAMERCNTPGSARNVAVPSADGRFGRPSISGPMDTTKGRWPANVALDEWHDPVLRLRYNAPEPIWEFYRDRGALPCVQVSDPDVPVAGGSTEVLRASVSVPVDEREPSRGAAPDVRQEALLGFAGEDAGEQGEQPERSGGPGVARGSAPCSRVRDGERVAPVGVGTDALRVDAQQVVVVEHAGASTGDGAAPGTPASGGRGCSSPERDQDGQPASESRVVGQRDAQAGSCGDSPRAACASEGERTASRRVVEARESEIPPGWLRYFERTGRAIRCGAARLLDEQSGELASGAVVHEAGDVVSSAWRAMEGREDIHRRATAKSFDASAGGASRFFYTAKASRSEREAGLTGAKSLDGGVWGGAEDDLTEGKKRTVARANTHPTVKPVDLMRWLVRLVTPLGGTVLDPFLGSGTTLVAALQEGCKAIGIEREASYIEIARARVAHEAAQGNLFSAMTP